MFPNHKNISIWCKYMMKAKIRQLYELLRIGAFNFKLILNNVKQKIVISLFCLRIRCTI